MSVSSSSLGKRPAPDELQSSKPKKVKSKDAIRRSRSKRDQNVTSTKTSNDRAAQDVAVPPANRDFKAIRCVLRMPLAPVFAQEPLEGVRQALDSWVMRYVPTIDAVLLTVSWPPTILEQNATLVASSAFANTRIRWEGIGFRPEIGSTSSGRLSLATPSVVSLLMYNLFNASIAKENIPEDTWEWDPEAKLPYSLAVPSQTQPNLLGIDTPGDADNESQAEEMPIQEEEEPDLGCWVHRETREPLGGTDGRINFTVIGLTIAQSMISVHGSLMPNARQTVAPPATASKRRKKT